MSKNNEKDAKALVTELLESISQGESTGSTIALSKRHPDMELEISFDGFDTTDDVGILISVLVSMLGTVVASSPTGFAGAVRDDLLRQLGEIMVKEGRGGVEQRHVDFVHNLLRAPLDKLVQEDNQRPLDEAKLPANLRNLAVAVSAFGVLMYLSGKDGKDIKFQTGYARAITSVIKKAMKDSGIDPDIGSVTAMIDTVVVGAVTAAEQHYRSTYPTPEAPDERTAQGDQDPGLPPSS